MIKYRSIFYGERGFKGYQDTRRDGEYRFPMRWFWGRDFLWDSYFSQERYSELPDETTFQPAFHSGSFEELSNERYMEWVFGTQPFWPELTGSRRNFVPLNRFTLFRRRNDRNPKVNRHYAPIHSREKYQYIFELSEMVPKPKTHTGRGYFDLNNVHGSYTPENKRLISVPDFDVFFFNDTKLFRLYFEQFSGMYDLEFSESVPALTFHSQLENRPARNMPMAGRYTSENTWVSNYPNLFYRLENNQKHFFYIAKWHSAFAHHHPGVVNNLFINNNVETAFDYFTPAEKVKKVKNYGSITVYYNEHYSEEQLKTFGTKNLSNHYLYYSMKDGCGGRANAIGYCGYRPFLDIANNDSDILRINYDYDLNVVSKMCNDGTVRDANKIICLRRDLGEITVKRIPILGEETFAVQERTDQNTSPFTDYVDEKIRLSRRGFTRPKRQMAIKHERAYVDDYEEIDIPTLPMIFTGSTEPILSFGGIILPNVQKGKNTVKKWSNNTTTPRQFNDGYPVSLYHYPMMKRTSDKRLVWALEPNGFDGNNILSDTCFTWCVKNMSQRAINERFNTNGVVAKLLQATESYFPTGHVNAIKNMRFRMDWFTMHGHLDKYKFSAMDGTDNEGRRTNSVLFNTGTQVRHMFCYNQQRSEASSQYPWNKLNSRYYLSTEGETRYLHQMYMQPSFGHIWCNRNVPSDYYQFCRLFKEEGSYNYKLVSAYEDSDLNFWTVERTTRNNETNNNRHMNNPPTEVQLREFFMKTLVNNPRVSDLNELPLWYYIVDHTLPYLSRMFNPLFSNGSLNFNHSARPVTQELHLADVSVARCTNRGFLGGYFGVFADIFPTYYRWTDFSDYILGLASQSNSPWKLNRIQTLISVTPKKAFAHFEYTYPDTIFVTDNMERAGMIAVMIADFYKKMRTKQQGLFGEGSLNKTIERYTFYGFCYHLLDHMGLVRSYHKYGICAKNRNKYSHVRDTINTLEINEGTDTTGPRHAIALMYHYDTIIFDIIYQILYNNVFDRSLMDEDFDEATDTRSILNEICQRGNYFKEGTEESDCYELKYANTVRLVRTLLILLHNVFPGYYRTGAEQIATTIETDYFENNGTPFKFEGETTTIEQFNERSPALKNWLRLFNFHFTVRRINFTDSRRGGNHFLVHVDAAHLLASMFRDKIEFHTAARGDANGNSVDYTFIKPTFIIDNTHTHSKKFIVAKNSYSVLFRMWTYAKLRDLDYYFYFYTDDYIQAVSDYQYSNYGGFNWS